MQSEFYLKHKKNIDSFINNAIDEDIGKGDFSSLSSITKNKINSLELISNEECTIAGLSLVGLIISKFNKKIKFISNYNDGQKRRDEFENSLVTYCIKEGIPILGICRGMQFLNNFFGGKIRKVNGHVASSHKINNFSEFYFST